MKIRIDSEQAKGHAIKCLVDCDISSGQQFILDDVDLTRTAAQNSLMWMIYTDMEKTAINEYAGSTKNEWHEMMKEKFLLNIYERDIDTSGGRHLRALQQLGGVDRNKESSPQGHEIIVYLTSTTRATPKQFSEYLDCLMSWCNDRAITYRHPSDLLRRAMGAAWGGYFIIKEGIK